MTNYWRTKPPFGTEIDFSHPHARGLVGYWPFNEGAGLRVNDLSGCGNHGTLTNFEPWSSDSGWCGGRSGSALQFDGVNDYVDVGNNNSLSISNSGTVSAWIYPTLIGTTARPIYTSKGSLDVNKSPYFGINMVGTDGYLSAMLGNGTVKQNILSTLKPSLNTWQFAALVWDGTNVSIYLNNSVYTTPQNNTVNFTGGGYAIGIYTIVTTRIFKGSIEDVRIWNRALSADEIKSLYLNLYEVLRRPMSSKIPFLKK